MKKQIPEFWQATLPFVAVALNAAVGKPDKDENKYDKYDKHIIVSFIALQVGDVEQQSKHGRFLSQENSGIVVWIPPSGNLIPVIVTTLGVSGCFWCKQGFADSRPIKSRWSLEK